MSKVGITITLNAKGRYLELNFLEKRDNDVKGVEETLNNFEFFYKANVKASGFETIKIS